MIPAAGYDLEAFRRATNLSNPEVIARFGVILAGAAGVWLGLGQWPVLIFAGSYATTVFLYGLMLRRFPPGIVSARQLAAVMLAEAITMLHWIPLYVFLWVQETAFTWFLNAAILASVMTGSMSARTEDRLLRWSDRVLITLLMVATTLLFWRQGMDLLPTLLVIAMCTLIMLWLQVAVLQQATVRRRLTQVERTAQEQQRIEAIGRLTAGVAHDFNNILTVIGGNLDLVREVSDPAEKQALLTEARSATGRAAAVTAQLLAYSRQSVLAPRTTELAACLARVEAFMSRLLPTSVRLSLHVTDDLPMIEIDATRLESALINLILNSRDAMPDGGAIMLSARSMLTEISNPDAPKRIVIAVADTGTGIDPAILSRVADPYFTTKPLGKGSGLGLSMVKGFAEQSGGNLTIRSIPGSGTVVEMILPVSPVAAAAQSGAVRWSATMATMRSSGT